MSNQQTPDRQPTIWETMSDPKHPIWRLSTIAVVLGCITLVLWLNASDFDETEIRAIFQMGLLYVGIEAVRHKLGA